MESNQALRKNPFLHGMALEVEEDIDGGSAASQRAKPVNGGIDMKSIREAIARIEAEAKATIAAESRSLAETRARAQAEDRIRLEAERKVRAATEARAAAINKEITELRARTDIQAGLVAIEQELLQKETGTVKRAHAPRQRAKGEQQALDVLQEEKRQELVTEKTTCAETKTHVQVSVNREQAEAEHAATRIVPEAECAATPHTVGQIKAKAAFRRKAPKTALLKARETVELSRLERECAEAEQQALTAMHEKMQAEEAARIEAEARSSADREYTRLAQARQEAEQQARQAIEAKCAAEQKLLEQAAEQAESQRKAAETAEARVQEAIALAARIEAERVTAEQQALEAMQQKLRAEEAACKEAELRANAEREAVMLAATRLAAEAVARQAGEARVSAEKRAVEAAQMQAEIEAQAAEAADSARARYEREEADVRVMAQQLIERISQQGEQLGDWRVRAEAVLAESPTQVYLKKTKNRMQSATSSILTGLVLTAGVAGLVTLAAQRNSLAQVSPNAATPLSAPYMAATLHDAKLQMSYELKVQPTVTSVARQGRTGHHR